MPEINRTIFNYIVGIILIVLTFPLQLIIAIILVFELKENPFFIQERGITLSNGRFRMLKFKTIRTDKANEFKEFKDFLIPIDEHKVTFFASFLRKSGLDELPQLCHIITGKMNLVGPRPLMLNDLVIMKNEYPEDYKNRDSLNLKPGITGLWQLFGDKYSGITDLIKFDIRYAQKKSILFDLKILLSTLLYVISRGKKIDLLGKLLND